MFNITRAVMLPQRCIVPAIATLALVIVPLAQAAPYQEELSGVWSGAMDVAGVSYELIITLQEGTDGSWTGLIDIPAQNLTGFPLTSIVAAAGSVSFAMAGIPGDPVFMGSWDAEAQTIIGDLEQGGQVFAFSLSRTADAPTSTAVPIDPEIAAKATGSWAGTISAGEQILRLIFHIEVNANGALVATMDSPDQAQTGLPINAVTFDGTSLRLDLTYAGAYFLGAMSTDGTMFDGDWNQGGGSVPLRVTKQ